MRVQNGYHGGKEKQDWHLHARPERSADSKLMAFDLRRYMMGRGSGLLVLIASPSIIPTHAAAEFIEVLQKLTT